MAFTTATTVAETTSLGERSAAVGHHPVLRFLLRRIGAGILTLLAATILIFLATNVLPGNAAEVILGRGAQPAVLHHLDAELGLDRSEAARYLSWLNGLLHGNFGMSAVSVIEGRPDASISDSLGSPLADSGILAGITAVLLIPLTLGLGALAGLRPAGGSIR